jgi:hypothetical protein
VEGLIDVDVVTREGAAQDQVTVVVVLDKTDLPGPGRGGAGPACTGRSGPIAGGDEGLGGRVATVK